ncbi:MAG: hemerythrin domain-containing protein [Candidatus Binatia bacterium]
MKARTKRQKPSVTARAKRATRTVVRVAKRAASSARRAAPARQSAMRAGQTDAVALLRADHKTLRRLLDDLKSATAVARQARLLAQVEEEIKAHTTIEEEIFYPAFRAAAESKKDRQMFHEATEEHRAADMVLKEVGAARGSVEVFSARAKVLKELVEHHAEEEETEMFPRARTLIEPAELRRLGMAMAERKRTLKRPGTLRTVAAYVGVEI